MQLDNVMNNLTRNCPAALYSRNVARNVYAIIRAWSLCSHIVDMFICYMLTAIS